MERVNGIRRQVAALPGAASNLDRAAAAYRAGDDTRGERLFHDAFLDIAPLVRMVVRDRVDGPEDREDAFQSAMTNIWRAVQAGRAPAATVYAFGASVDRFRREQRHESRRMQPGHGDYQHTTVTTDGEHDQAWLNREPSVDDHTEQSSSLIEVERMVRTLFAVRPLWGDIAMCLAAGLTQAETARALDRPRGTITRNVVEIRRHLEARSAA